MIKIITKLSILILCTYIGQSTGEEVNYLIVEDKSTPFQVTHKGQSSGGIITDIIDEVFRGSPHTVKYHILPLNRLYKMLDSGELKNWIAYDAKAWNSLSQWGNFVPEPLFPVNHAYLTCKEDSPEQITSASQLSNQHIAIIKDFIQPELRQLQKTNQLNLISVDNYQQGINLAALNRVDGFVEMELRLRFNVKKEAIRHPCLQFIDMSEVIPVYSIYLSTDKSTRTGINKFANERIKALKEAGTINKIMQRYTLNTRS